ncbi:melatonin receptor type 1A-like [Ptychodera flava]|uniref:melatonin receptor type 1A-like n=1 Tax=Ptychodera flava TaxID=63121 RepID=UPI00396A0D69
MSNSMSTNVSYEDTFSGPAIPPGWVLTVTGLVEVFLTASAILGNLLFVTVFCLQKKLRTTINTMLFNLSITDLISPILVSSLTGDGFLKRLWRFGYSLCVINKVLHRILLETSLWLTTCVAINRYICIVHHEKYHRFSNRKTLSFALMFSWCFPVATQVYLHTRPNAFRYVEGIFPCVLNVSGVFTLASLTVQIVLTVYSYLAVFLFIRRSRNRVQAHSAGDDTSTNNSKTPSLQEIRTLKVLMAVFLLIIFGYIPVPLVGSIFKALGRPEGLAFLILLHPAIHIGGAVNPILYGISNRNVRESYRQILTGQKIFGRPCCGVNAESQVSAI